MDDLPTRREVWLSMLAAIGAGAVGGYWASGVRVPGPSVSEGARRQVAARPGESFWEGADPAQGGVRVLDVAHDLNNPTCRRLRPALEALVRATSDLALRWRDWPTGGEESWAAAVALRAMALADRLAAIELLHQTAAWEGPVTARRLRGAWPSSLGEDLLATAGASVAADVAWAEGLGLRAPPSVLEGGRLLGVGALPVEQWRERLGLDG